MAAGNPERIAEYAGQLVDEWGFDRTEFMLANTIRWKIADECISQDNKDWAQAVLRHHDKTGTDKYLLEYESGLLNQLAEQVQELYRQMKLIDSSSCIEKSYNDMDFIGRVVVLRDETLKEEMRTPENQLWVAEGGFGCSPTARGRRVFCTSLADGEETSFYRQDFIGVMKDECIPEWAAENLENLEQLKQDYKSQGQNMSL